MHTRWNSSVLIVFGIAAGVFFALSIAGYADPNCRKVGLQDAPFGCAEFVFYRYQTFLVGVLALASAIWASLHVQAQLQAASLQNRAMAVEALRKTALELTEAIDACSVMMTQTGKVFTEVNIVVADGAAFDEGLSDEILNLRRAASEFIPTLVKTSVSFPSDQSVIVLIEDVWNKIDDIDGWYANDAPISDKSFLAKHAREIRDRLREMRRGMRNLQFELHKRRQLIWSAIRSYEEDALLLSSSSGGSRGDG